MKNSEMDKLFNEIFGNFYTTYDYQTAKQPSSNVEETESSFVIETAVPGLSKEDIEIKVKENNLLSISFEKKEGDKFKFISNSFDKNYKLPKTVDIEKISAKVENGVLTIEIPKKEAEKPKEIKIEIK